MESSQEYIIPTRIRGKISHKLSWPLGAELITQSLRGAPQLSRIVVGFRNENGWHPIRSGRYPFLRAMHISGLSRPINSDPETLPLFSEWEIVVRPVPRSLRHKVRKYCIETALPSILHWLSRRADNQLDGSEMLTFFYDEHADRFSEQAESRAEPARR